MRYNKKFLLGLLVLGLLAACTQTPQQRAKNATVLMVIGNADGTHNNGSGFFVERDKIVTNIHVVAGARMISAVGIKKVYNVKKVAGYDPERDLVILKVSGEGEPLELGIGEKDHTIFATGYPGGDYEERTGKIHSIRSDKQLRLVSPEFPRNTGNFVTASGSSGGPILNNKGQVVGIIVAGDENFSFASAASALNVLLDSSDKDLSDWQKEDPIRAYAAFKEGESWRRKQQYDRALEAYEESIGLYDFAQARYNLGRVKVDLGEAKSQQGNRKHAQKLYEEAINDFSKVVTFVPDNHEAYRALGKVNLSLGQLVAEQDKKKACNYYIEAIRNFNKGLRIIPNDIEAFNGLGGVNLSLGQLVAEQDKEKARNYYNEAIRYFSHVIDLDPNNADAYRYRGAIYKGIEKQEEGEADFQRAREIEH